MSWYQLLLTKLYPRCRMEGSKSPRQKYLFTPQSENTFSRFASWWDSQCVLLEVAVGCRFFGLSFLLLKNTSILKGALGNLKLRMFTQFIAQYNFWLIEFEVSLAAGSRGSKEQETTFWILSPKSRCCNDSIPCRLAGLFIWETEEQQGCFLGTGWSLCVGLKKPDPSGAAVAQAVKLCTHCTLRKRQS